MQNFVCLRSARGGSSLRMSGLASLLFSIFSTPSLSQEISSSEVLAPTQFQDEVQVDSDLETSMFREFAPADFRQSGWGQVETLSLRGGRSADIGVYLEGIPLSSEALGPIDLREAGSLGLSRYQIVRGSFVPLSSYPQGQIHLKLETEKDAEVSLGYGSFQWRQLSLESSNINFRYQAAENDYFVKDGDGGSRTRQEGYGNREFQVRALKEFSNWKLIHQFHSSKDWTGFGYGIQNTSFLLGASGQVESWNWALWSQIREQDLLPDNDSNWSLRTGQRLHRIWTPLEKHSFESSLEFKQDQLWHHNFDTPVRWTIAWTPSWLFTPKPGQIIQARLRNDWTSDLRDEWSFQPQIGGRHSLSNSLEILWNLSRVETAPDFYDLYTDISDGFGDFIANPDLRKETSLQGDLGYEWTTAEGRLRLRQVLFYSRSSDLIQRAIEVSPGIFQSENANRARRWGLENQAQWLASPTQTLEIQYRWIQTSSSRGPLLYVPRHQLSAKPEQRIGETWSLSLPLWWRSSVYTQPEKADEIKNQWELGLQLQYQGERLGLEMAAHNLLRNERQDDAFSQLPEETWFQFLMRWKI